MSALVAAALYYAIIYNITTFNENKYLALIHRTLIGYIFCFLGYIYYAERERLNNTAIFILSTCTYCYLSIKFGTFGYSSVFNDYGSGIGKDISFLVSISGIFIVISASNFIAKRDFFLKREDTAWLGKNSFHIMALHLSGFLVLNCALALIGPNKHLSDITGIYFRYPNVIWAYFFFSMTYCVTILKLAERGKILWAEHKARKVQQTSVLELPPLNRTPC